ncbi:50S ribosomal protein L2 [Candidatus Pacearchaeota archaeon CG_4_10_14_0_2_um_filter_05_32_18]|nr:MAG: 50S ribosomal protein L2 [Candidatus Pacearchaeota archaeon CG_4_10_14_0_2_um_filter_05_32_18]
MGKRIISQARGHGSLTYRVRSKAFIYEIKYPLQSFSGEGEIVKFIHSGGHSAPLAKIKLGEIIFFNPSANGMYEGQKISIGKDNGMGSIVKLKDIPTKATVYNIEANPGDGGKFIRSAGSFATITKKSKNDVIILMPSKKEKVFSGDCRASIGVIAGNGRKDKPVMKAGRMFYIKKAKNKLWPRTSAVKMNVIDHPFGSGRGKNLTHGNLGKIPKRNAPPGARVGSIRARRTGKRKAN